jgi:RimJ/RimL family protein N-acetyltransferase
MEMPSFAIERSRDWVAIKKLATDPAIFPHICDDFSLNPESWEPPRERHVVTLLAGDREGFFGFGIFIPSTWVCYQAHVGFLPRSYGEKALGSFKKMIEWMWAMTSARRIVGEVCSENRRAIRFAERAGFSFYGVNKKSRLRGGVLRDQACLGISKV